MYKKLMSITLCFFVFLSALFCPVFSVSASESEFEHIYGRNYDSLSVPKKIACWFSYITSVTGKVVNVDTLGATSLVNDFTDYISGSNLSKPIENMTNEEQTEVLENFMQGMEEKGCTCDNSGEVTLSDDFIKEFRSWFDEYLEENTKPLYWLVHVPSIDQIYPSNLGVSYKYNQLKQAVEELDFVSFRFYTNSIYFYDIPYNSDLNFFIGNYNLTSASTDGKFCAAHLYDIASETMTKYPIYSIEFDEDYNIISDIENNYTSCSPTASNDSFYLNYIDAFQSHNKTACLPSNYLNCVAKEDMYVKVFSSLANYQNYNAGKYEPDVFYTSNYYITENIQQSPTSLDDMVKLYEAYDELCQKILQYVKDTQDATDTQVVKKLDELIQAVYSTSGSGGSSGGTTDVTVDVDMSETNGILNSILKKLEEVAQDVKSILDTPILESDNLDDWKTTVNNIVASPETYIDATVGDMADSFGDTVSLLKTKFPFSIPWDIAFLIGFLADTPETPTFDIPLKMESWNIDYTLTIDFTHFESVSKVSRILLSMLYAYSLILITDKVVNIKKGD